MANPNLSHGEENRVDATDVFAVVTQRVCHGFAYRLLCGQVDHTVYLMVSHCPREFWEVQHAGADQGNVAGYSLGQAGGQIVIDNNIIAGYLQRSQYVRADVTRTTGQQPSAQ